MGQRAKVTSIDAVGIFAAALRGFKHEASEVLDGLDQAVHRAVQWVQHDQKHYWKQQLQRSQQQVEEARLNLHRCLTYKRIGDYRPACIEEKRALERAKRRLHLCRQKLQAVQKWSRAIERAALEYRVGVGQLAQWIESDSERALALLDRISDSLDHYVAVEPSAEMAAALARLPSSDDEIDQTTEEDSPSEPEGTEGDHRGPEASGARQHGPEEEASP